MTKANRKHDATKGDNDTVSLVERSCLMKKCRMVASKVLSGVIHHFLQSDGLEKHRLKIQSDMTFYGMYK